MKSILLAAVGLLAILPSTADSGEPKFDAVILMEAKSPDISLLYVVITQPKADVDKLNELVVRYASAAIRAASEHNFEGTINESKKPQYQGNVAFLIRASREDRDGFCTGFSVEQLREIAAANPAAGKNLVASHAWGVAKIPDAR